MDNFNSSIRVLHDSGGWTESADANIYSFDIQNLTQHVQWIC